jgi:hypothetical protein
VEDKMFTSLQAEFCKTVFSSRYPAVVSRSGQRIQAAARILAANALRNSFDIPGVWEVKSESVGNRWYRVDPARRTCSCPDSKAGHMCKHRIAVGFALSLPTWAGEDIQITLADSHAKAVDQAAAHEKSLAYAYASAAGNEPERQVVCTVSYGGTPYKAVVMSMRRRSDEGYLVALVTRQDDHYWYNDTATIEVRAFDCKDFHIQ